jgi:hypothetical protein
MTNPSHNGGHGVPGYRWVELALVALAVAIALLSLLVSLKVRSDSKALAWEFSGGQACSNYRAQILALYQEGVDQEGIKRWFSAEAGGEDNPIGDVSEGENALASLEEGCGSVEELLAVLR